MLKSTQAALVFTTLCAALALSACGQKGALYLPDGPTTMPSPSGQGASGTAPADPNDY